VFGNPDFEIAQYNANATLDTAFGVGGPDGNGVVTSNFLSLSSTFAIAFAGRTVFAPSPV